MADVPLFGGLKVLETEGKKAGKFGPANDAVIEKLIEAGTLLARGRLEHSYPHSWRSKAPVIYRATPQWFVPHRHAAGGPVHGGRTLRETALAAIDATAFYPPASRNRIRSMVETRPDWLISRQRAWGSPLAMFVDRETGQPLHDEQVNARIVNLIADEGADAWFTRPPRDFLGNHDPERYEKVEDILDVWFDSGSTHAFVLENRPHTRWPADLYLEGADQHRGWFQSSLLESSRHPRPRALRRGHDPRLHPRREGRGEDVEVARQRRRAAGRCPARAARRSCACGRRWWTMARTSGSAPPSCRPRSTPTARSGTRCATCWARWRALRRTRPWRWPTCRRWSASSCTGCFELDGKVRAAYEAYEFEPIVRALGDFCSNDLSALFFDIRRDVLYCDPPQRLRRRAARTVMDLAFERLTVWLGPILAFTCEEAWSTRFPDAGPNACGCSPRRRPSGRTSPRPARWRAIERVTRVVTGALEVERREKRIGAALEAAPVVYIADPDLKAAFHGLDAAEMFRTSAATLADGEGPAGRVPPRRGARRRRRAAPGRAA